MEEFKKEDYTDDVVNRIQRGRTLHFMNKENRDKAFILVKQAGLNARKTTSSNQRIHPEYIEDYKGTIETGFGNSMYNMNFSKLYNLEIRQEYDMRRRY